ncbi:hypothetical protein SNEBB_000654 [Seison nebaliae]|nr:hypothetical protein SNEBB_000654 [Seison nebaliae]
MTTTVNDSSSIDIKLTNESSKEELEYDKDGFYITIGKIHVPPEHSTSTNSKVEEERKNIIAQINSTRPKNAPSITHRFFVEEHTTNNHPIPSVPKEHIVTINKIIDKLLVKGIIEPSENSHDYESFMTVPTGRNNSKPRSTIKCFDHLKNELMNAPKLFYPHPYRYFVLQTYIKERTVKAILHQEDEKGRQYLIEFSGRHYKPKEIHYEQLQMAIVAAIYGIEKHRKYLKDNIFCLLFNTNALNWIEAAKDNPISNQWKTLSNQFSFEMKHAINYLSKVLQHISNMSVIS